MNVISVQDEDDVEDELEFPSEQSSACDCPAHLHDRESPLLIAQVINQSINQSINQPLIY